MSEEEANITACRHFCEHQRMLASREKKESATPKPSTTKAPLMRSLAHPNRAFYQAPDWEGALEIGYRDLGNINLYDYHLAFGALRPKSVGYIDISADGIICKRVGLVGERQETVESLTPQQLVDAEIAAEPNEWSGVNREHGYLVLHPNGPIASRARLVNAVPAGTREILALVDVAHIESALYRVRAQGHQPTTAGKTLNIRACSFARRR